MFTHLHHTLHTIQTICGHVLSKPNFLSTSCPSEPVSSSAQGQALSLGVLEWWISLILVEEAPLLA